MKFLIRAGKMLFYVVLSVALAFFYLYIGYQVGKSEGHSNGYADAIRNTHFATESDIQTMIATCEAYQ
jgi:hypothetical protein